MTWPATLPSHQDLDPFKKTKAYSLESDQGTYQQKRRWEIVQIKNPMKLVVAVWFIFDHSCEYHVRILGKIPENPMLCDKRISLVGFCAILAVAGVACNCVTCFLANTNKLAQWMQYLRS